MGLTRLIEAADPDGSRRQCLSEARLQKAETLLEERQCRNQDLDLLNIITCDWDIIVKWTGYMEQRLASSA
jgi:hypothetical protein